MLPQAVDTPIFDHAANRTDGAVRPIPPLSDAEAIAEGILRCARDPQPEVTYGFAGRVLETMHAATPRLYDRIAPPLFADGTFAGRSAPADPDGNLYQSRSGAAHGGWKTRRRRALVQAFFAAVRGGLRGLGGRAH